MLNFFYQVYGAGLLSSAAELQFVMDGIESGSLPLLKLEEESVCNAEMMVSLFLLNYKIGSIFNSGDHLPETVLLH